MHPARLLSRSLPLLCVLTGVTVCLRGLAGSVIPLPVLSLMCCVLLTALSLERKPSLSLPLALLSATLLLSLLLHPRPDFPLRAMRLAALTAGLLCFSPLTDSPAITHARSLLLRTILCGLAIMVSVSFIIWLGLTLRYGTSLRPGFIHYGFTGIFGTGILLSSVSAVTCIAAGWKALSGGPPRQRLLSLALCVISLVCCIAGGSRAALAALLSCQGLLLWACRHRIRNALGKPSLLLTALAAVLLTACSLPWASQTLLKKIKVSADHHSLIFSRRQMWQTRIDEFASSPLLGIGYANEFPQDNPLKENIPGSIEPGSSWLTVLTYGGIMAAVPFLWFLAELARRLWRRRRAPDFPLLLALLIFFLMNGLTEGWLLFAGSLMFPLFWLTCARIYDGEMAVSGK